MGRPKGSTNRARAEAPLEQQASVVLDQPNNQDQSNKVNRVYKEGGASISIPRSNTSAALFPSESTKDVPRGTNQAVIEEEKPKADDTEPVKEDIADKVEVSDKETTEQQPDLKSDDTDKKDLDFASDQEVYLEDLLERMKLDPDKVKTRTKIDGKEIPVSYSEVKKGYQIDQHLSKRGQKIGEERRQLEALRQELAKSGQQPAGASNTTGDPDIDSLRSELDQIKSILPQLQPVIYQTARQKLANELKDQGFDDFMNYIDRIDARVAMEADESKWRYYNTFDGAKQLYFQLKLEDQLKASKTAQSNQPERKQESAPKPSLNSRPPIVKIDGGNSATKPQMDEAAVKYGQLIAEWKKDPRRNAHLLPEILKLKGAIFLE